MAAQAYDIIESGTEGSSGPGSSRSSGTWASDSSAPGECVCVCVCVCVPATAVHLVSMQSCNPQGPTLLFGEIGSQSLCLTQSLIVLTIALFDTQAHSPKEA